YEWAGQRRVRSTALIEGGLVAAGIADVCSGKPSDEDVDVDTRDETHYGVAQYSDSDIVQQQPNGGQNGRALLNQCNRSHERRPSDPAYEFDAVEPANTAELQIESVAVEPSPQSDTYRMMPATTTGGGASQLVIDALKARIREQDRELQRVPKCSVCQSGFEQPCASINCWHVFCEQCWMQSLGLKKLCPQCQQITQPYDLRRIYM
ncbi:hypothetical protein IWW50_000795, partial [Coemansia erecta]